MKKILTVLFGLLIFNLSFSEDNYLKNINTKELENILIENGFNLKEDNYLKGVSFYKKEDGKFGQKVTLVTDNGKLTSLGIGAFHYATNPRQKIIKNDLLHLVIKINNAIEDEEMKKNILNSVYDIATDSMEGNPDTKEYKEKLGKFYEFENYTITSESIDSFKGLGISCNNIEFD